METSMDGTKRIWIASYTKKDFRVDTFCSGGNGGQHQNKTQSGVRITCIPLGLASESREFKSQRQNKKAAFYRLGMKIKRWHQIDEAKELVRNTETIRTYHTVDNRVKNHKSGFQQTYDEVERDITKMIEDNANAFTE